MRTFEHRFIKEAYLLALDDKSDEEIAKHFRISFTEYLEWLIDYPEFAKAIERGAAQSEVLAINERFHRGYGGPVGTVASVQGGGVSAPTLTEFDFTAGLPSGITVTRATTGMKVGSDGTLSSVAINTGRFGYEEICLRNSGILIEEAQANLVNSPSFAGAANGVIGSGGALPAGWAFNGGLSAGLTATIANLDANGFDLAITGTPSGGAGSINLRATGNGASGVTVVAGETWCMSAWVRALATTGLTSINTSAQYYTAGGSLVGSQITQLAQVAQSDVVFPIHHIYDVPATAARLHGHILGINYQNAALTITYRIERPQIEKRGFRSVYQPAASRSADDVTFTSASSLFGSAPFTVELDFRAGRKTGTATLWEAKLDANNRIELKLNAWLLQCVSVVAGVATTTDIGEVVPLGRMSVALAVSSGGIAASLNGKTAKTSAVAPPTGLTTATLGSGTSGYLNGHVLEVRHSTAPKSGAEVAAASLANGPIVYDDYDRADGALGTAPTGQAWQSDNTGGTKVVPTISSGRMVTADSGAGATASYPSLDAGALCDLQICEVIWSTGVASSIAAPIATHGPLATDIGLLGAAHNKQTKDTGTLGYFNPTPPGTSADVFTYVLPSTRPAAEDGATKYHIGSIYPVGGNACVLLMSDGGYIRSTDALVKSNRGTYQMYEANRSGITKTMPSFGAVMAEAA